MNKKNLLFLSTVFLLSGCAEVPKQNRRATKSTEAMPFAHLENATASNSKRHFENDSLWIDDNIPGSPSIKISIGEQCAYLYKGGKLAGMTPISTGNEGNPTATGSFHITQMDPAHESTLYGNYVDATDKVIQTDVDTSKDAKPPGAIFKGATMAHFMRFNGGTGMHEGFMPGYADSHGCIRLPGWFAAALYDVVSVGTPVTVVR